MNMILNRVIFAAFLIDKKFVDLAVRIDINEKSKKYYSWDIISSHSYSCEINPCQKGGATFTTN